MSSQVVVVFSRGSEYEFAVPDAQIAALGHDEAHRWLDQQWLDLDCVTTNPVGKVLLLDKILGIARNGGEKHFASADEWARRFACAVATLLDRRAIRVDVAGRVVG